MSTVKEIIYKIKERHTGFNITDDYPVIDDLIYSFMNDIRETLIREEYNNTRQINEQYYQMLCCLEIECLEDNCTYKGEKVYNSINVFQVKIPQRVTRVGGLDIKHIGSKNGQHEFSRYSFGGFNSLNARIWTKNIPAYTIISDDVWLRNLYTPSQKFICALVLLKDPVKACDWDDDKSTYPVPSETKLIDLVLYKLQSSNKVIDVLNNAADDTMPPKINNEVVAQQQQALRGGNTNERQRQER